MDEQKQEDESDYGAFIKKFQLQPPPFSSSSNEPHLSLPLRGLDFAVKDIFDISGYVTGFGSPDWARTHAAATSTAPVVSALINAGATCVGKAIMDELAFSVNGENKHYGTPINPCAPDRAPGGSSSGSAVAVAAKLVDFSLGTDTGGSVRVPAAYCGILGFRPSHGIISISGVIPFAQSFDTVGWFARDPSILTKVGRVLLQLPFDVTTEPTHIIVPEDCFQRLGSPNDGVSDILINSVQKIFGSVVINQENFGDYLSHRVPSLNSFMSEVSNDEANIIAALSALSSANTILQRFEFKANHYEWINKVKADFGPGVIARLSGISKETFENIDIYQTLRAELQTAMDALLEDFGVLAIPTITGPPPELQMKTQTLGDFRAHALRLVCIAGLSGICQVTIPLGMHDNLPVSISLLASKGNDQFLLKLAETLYATLREEAAIAWELDIEASK